MSRFCSCDPAGHAPRRVVLTGGPGAGKTTVLEIVRRSFCEHTRVLAEAAGIVFAGGFPRKTNEAARRAAQRAIYHVQDELERLALDEGGSAVILCDRGTIDGIAYWPASPESYFSEIGTDEARELARYAAVIHLRTPPAESGYNLDNPVRIESAAEARRIDERIAWVWRNHPSRHFVENEESFFTKVSRAVGLLRAEVPDCCREHFVPEADLAPPTG